MLSDQSRIIEQAKCTYSPLGKVFEKQIKTIEDQGMKQVEALKALKPEENQVLKSIEGLFPKNMRTNEIKSEIDEIKKWEDKIIRKDLKCEANKCIYDFEQFETIRSVGDNICIGKICINEAEMDQSNLSNKIREKKEVLLIV